MECTVCGADVQPNERCDVCGVRTTVSRGSSAERRRSRLAAIGVLFGAIVFGIVSIVALGLILVYFFPEIWSGQD